MISLQLWLLALLVALPFYTYSFNQPGQQEDVFQKRNELDDVNAELERRQQIATDPDVLASVSSVLQSVSDVIKSVTENPADFTASLSEIEASLSSVILSVSSDLFPIITEEPSATATGGDDDDDVTGTPLPTTSQTTTAPPEGTPGQVVTSGGKTGTVGEDGTTRFCSDASYLCPASVNYGCCRDGYRCGLTQCTPTGNNVPTTAQGPSSCSFGSFLCPSSLGYGCCPNGYECNASACVPTATDGPSVSRTDIPFVPTDGASKGGAEDGGDNSDNNSGGGGGGLSGGAIGGIVGGVIGGLALVGAGLFFLFKKRKNDSALATTTPTTGPAPAPTGGESYTGGPLPPQPQMAQYNSPTSPPPHEFPSPQQGGQGGFYQPYPQQYQQQPAYQYGGGQNVSELGGAAMPYGQKGPEAPPADVVEAPAHPVQQPNANQGGAGYKGAPSGPVYELS